MSPARNFSLTKGILFSFVFLREILMTNVIKLALRGFYYTYYIHQCSKMPLDLTFKWRARHSKNDFISLINNMKIHFRTNQQ